MMGNNNPPEDIGIIPRYCYELFHQIEQSKKSSELLIKQTETEKDLSSSYCMEVEIEVSYYEIYNEKIYDLLSNTTNIACKVREHPIDGAYVENLILRKVKSYQDIQVILEEGQNKRQVAETLMNAASSRSHAVFTLYIQQKILVHA